MIRPINCQLLDLERLFLDLITFGGWSLVAINTTSLLPLWMKMKICLWKLLLHLLYRLIIWSGYLSWRMSHAWEIVLILVMWPFPVTSRKCCDIVNRLIFELWKWQHLISSLFINYNLFSYCNIQKLYPQCIEHSWLVVNAYVPFIQLLVVPCSYYYDPYIFIILFLTLVCETSGAKKIIHYH